MPTCCGPRCVLPAVGACGNDAACGDAYCSEACADAAWPTHALACGVKRKVVEGLRGEGRTRRTRRGSPGETA